MDVGSRDDFIIAIRSAFLKKGNQQRFSLIFLIIISLTFLVLGKINFKPIDHIKIAIREIVYRSSFVVSIPENYNDYFEIKDEIKKLKAQRTVDQFIVEENKRLNKIIDDYVAESDEVVAKIIIDKNSPFLRSLIVNKGSKNNIKLGMAVLDSNYLVGKVIEVNYLTSRILLLSDLNSKIPVIIEPGNFQSILSGTGKNDGILQYLKEDYLIEENSKIYTSGAGALFKAGIPIGEIEISETNKEKKVDFFSDFSQLRFVKIISFEKDID
jgi:rod shape-determining protein MreC